MYPVAISLILLVGLVCFAYTAYMRMMPLLRAPKSDRFRELGRRIWGVLEFAFGQKRVLFKDFRSGIFHAFIFWGFCVVAIRSVTLFGRGFDAGFVIPGLSGHLGDIYDLVKDIFQALVIIGTVALLIRRIVFRPKRLNLSLEADLILIAIFLLMVTDMFIDGSDIAIYGISPSTARFMPLGVMTAHLLTEAAFSMSTLKTIFTASYFAHTAGILAFLNYLPYGKHFHIITSIPNVFFRNLRPYGALIPINLEDETATTFGIDKIEQFDWKSILDMYSCTECGRCQDQCPAYACEKPLSPKDFTTALRDHLYSMSKKSSLFRYFSHPDRSPCHPEAEPKDLPLKHVETGDSSLVSLAQNDNGRPALIGDVVKKETIWSCTTCRACEEACPLLIEYVQKMIDLRRHMVLMQGDISPEAQTTLKNIETNSNPWGIGFAERGTWAKELGIKTLAEDKNVEYLYFVGCAGSFDERAKKVSKAFTKLLQKAGVSFGILGEEEHCTGDSARRLGNEYLFQMLAKQNVEMFNKYGVKRILTTCPHCYNTIKNELPQFGGNYEVHHHTEFLRDMLTSGRLTIEPSNHRTIEPSNHRTIEPTTFHDSCYLGRYNNIYDAPREILKLAGLKTVEMEKSKKYGRCCGAGGGWMWMEDKIGTRISHKRLEDIEATGATNVASACPFCLTMLTDATKEKNVEEKYQVKDIAEVLLEAVS